MIEVISNALPFVPPIATIIAAIGVYFAAKALWANHEWNRRKASHDLLVELATGNVLELRRALEIQFGARWYDPRQTYKDVKDATSSHNQQDLHFTTRSLLNYYESIAIGIKNNVLADDICFDFAAKSLISFWRWAQPLILEGRADNVRLWADMEELTDRWNERLRLRVESKAPTGGRSA